MVITIFLHLLLLFVLLRVTFLYKVIIPSLLIELIVEPEPEPEKMRIEELKLKPVVSGKKIDNTPPVSTEAAKIDDQSGDVETPVEKPAEIDNRSLFSSNDAGTITDNASGESLNSRALFTGEPGASSELIEEVTSVSLNGRSIVGEMEQPMNTSNREGRVVIEITVDQQGKVTQARARARGSSIQNTMLWKAAEEAARKTQFNADLNSPALQIGTITYVFKLK